MKILLQDLSCVSDKCGVGWEMRFELEWVKFGG